MQGDGDDVLSGDDDKPADDAEPAQPKWDPKAFKWTVTNRVSKNLAHIFVSSKGPKGEHSVKQAKEFAIGRDQQISLSMEKFIAQVMASESDGKGKSFYQ